MTWMEAGTESVIPITGWNVTSWEQFHLPDRDAYRFHIAFVNGIVIDVDVDNLVLMHSASTPRTIAEKLMQCELDRVVGEWSRLGREDRDW